MVLDGYGLMIEQRVMLLLWLNTPVMDKLMKECPFQKGYASGLAVVFQTDRWVIQKWSYEYWCWQDYISGSYKNY